MFDQDVRWKSLGCGMMMVLVVLCFWGMLSATDGLAKRKRARAGQTATTNLQAVAIGVNAYEADKKALPPTESSAAFKAALVPKYLADASMLSEPVSGKPFVPNPNLKPDSKITNTGRRKVYLLSAAVPNKSGQFATLLLSGETRDVSGQELLRLTVPPAPPAPAPTPKPLGSPALAPQ